MQLIPISDLGQVGIIRGPPPYQLPPNVWSDGNNVRFLDNGVKKCSGYEEVFATLPFAPYYITPFLDNGGTYWWFAFGLNNAAVWDGSSWTDITRQNTGTLNATINDSVTTITLTDASAFPSSGSIALGTKANLDAASNGYEEITYSGKSTNDLTGCSRAANSTTAAEHTSAFPVVPISTTATGDNLYNTTTSENWRVTILNGLLVATNGFDTPQMWPLANGVPNKTIPLRTLQNWGSKTNSGANYYCRSMAAFKTFLVGLNWGIGGVEYPNLVKWSTEASALSPPFSWDESDATLDAGEYQLTDTPGKIMDGLPYGDSFLIYKEDSIYVMNYVGTPYIFSFKLLSPTIGLLAKNAVAEFDAGHFFIGNSDCYITNGQQVTALLPNKMRREMFSDLNGDNYEKVFVAADYARNEMLACYPSGISTIPDKALIWNWKDNTFSLRGIPDLYHINSGIAEITTGVNWPPQTTLNGAITAGSPATSGSLTVTSTVAADAVFSTPTGTVILQGDTAPYVGEQITYTGTTSTTFTGITRGANGTTAASHDNSIAVNQVTSTWDTVSGIWGAGNYDSVLKNLVFAKPDFKATISGATAANPVVLTTTVHGLSDSDKVSISGVVGMTQLNGNVYYAKVTGYSTTTFALYSDSALTTTVDGSGYTAWSSGGNVDMPKMYRDDRGNQEDGTNMISYIERTGYDLGDPSSQKFVSAVWPKLEVSGDNNINVYVGSQMSTEEGITWNPANGGNPYLFNPNTQSKVSCRITGKFFGVKFESTSDIDWKVHGVEFEVTPRGRRGSRSY